MKRKSIWCGLLLGAALWPSLAFADDDLCPKAATWFSCPLDNGKTLAICGSPSTTPDVPVFGADDDAWLQYRYGTADHIELRFPDATGDRLWRAFLGGITFTPNGNPEQVTISFTIGDLRYLIEGTQLPYQGPKDYRLTITDTRDGTRMADHQCLSADAYDLLPLVEALPCDPAYNGNRTRGARCK